MKLIPAYDVIKVKKDDKRNTKRRYLTTDGICFKCGCIVNYNFQNRCILCCGSEDFLVGEPGRVLRELLELDIEQLRIACELRSGNVSGSRTKMTLELFKLIFPKLTKVDDRIDELLIRKIIYRNRKKFWYIKDIEDAINDIRHVNKRWYKTYTPKYIRLIEPKDMAE